MYNVNIIHRDFKHHKISYIYYISLVWCLKLLSLSNFKFQSSNTLTIGTSRWSCHRNSRVPGAGGGHFRTDQGPEMHVHRPAPREISTDASIERTRVMTGIHDLDPHINHVLQSCSIDVFFSFFFRCSMVHPCSTLLFGMSSMTQHWQSDFFGTVEKCLVGL